MDSTATKDNILEALRSGKIPDLNIPGWSEEFPLLDHQKVGVAWMIMTPKCLLADSVGVGKTGQAIGLLQWLKTTGQLSNKRRAIVIVPAISVYGSWKNDGFDKFVPDALVAIGRGTKAQRRKIYEDSTWEILLTNYETVRNDVDILQEMGFEYVILDEADVVRNHDTKAAKAVKKITKKAKRVVSMTATPIQNHLIDLHGILEATGLGKEFGTLTQFKKEYQQTELKKVFYNGRWNWKRVTVGYQNTSHLKELLQPYYMRRTYKDIEAKMPELMSQPKYVEMTPEQARLYKEIQSGYLQLTPDSPRFELKAAALRLRQCCTTTANIKEDTDSSAKFDWIIKQLKGDWQDEKIVMFSNWKNSIRALETRLKQNGIGYVILTGDENDQQLREQLRQEFWNNPDIQVLIGTTAIERSLNLQCAKIQLNLDMMWNPSRHGQLAGRVQRIGSIHDDVYVFSMIVKNSIEEGIMKLLQHKQAIFDHIFEEDSALFDKLSPEELVKLIRS